MKIHGKPDIGITGFALFFVIVAAAFAGCTDSPLGPQQSQAVSSGNVPAGHEAAAPAPSHPTGAVVLDAISEKNIGDRFTITGTTSLPEGTNLFWQIIPDTGVIPTGADMTAPIGIMANNQVTKGTGTANRVSLDVETKDLPAGKYVVIAVFLKGDSPAADPSTGTLAGYSYFTLKP